MQRYKSNPLGSGEVRACREPKSRRVLDGRFSTSSKLLEPNGSGVAHIARRLIWTTGNKGWQLAVL
jgi:hypothetical protein